LTKRTRCLPGSQHDSHDNHIFLNIPIPCYIFIKQVSWFVGGIYL
jgi:hypothetical protein